MAEYAKRPEVTVETMGKVENPSGEGIKAVSAQAQSKAMKLKAAAGSDQTAATTAGGAGGGMNGTHRHHPQQQQQQQHETRVKEEGSARRNITRKKSGAAEGSYDSRNKKQGGHGKGMWDEVREFEQLGGGAGAGDDYYPVPVVIDENDPLYDEAEHGNYILSGGGLEAAAKAKAASTTTNGVGGKNGSGGGGGSKRNDLLAEHRTGVYHEETSKAIYGPILTLPEFKIRLSETLREYFDSGDSDEVIRSIDELKCRLYHPEVVKKAVSLSLDEGPRERELVSRLLTCLHPVPLSDADMETGFDILLNSMDDLTIDIPDARTMVASFLARAVVDEVLPPAFLSNANNDRPGDEVIDKAVNLLSREHCTARLERVWGPGDGRPVAELKTVVEQLTKEYLLSRELDEAARCVRELAAPHFHHELVKRGATIAMEDHAAGTPRESLDALAALLAFLVENAIVSESQVFKGLARLHRTLPDLRLDVPAAPELLREFEDMIQERGCCSSWFRRSTATTATTPAAAATTTNTPHPPPKEQQQQTGSSS